MTKAEALDLLLKTLKLAPVGSDIERLVLMRDREARLQMNLLNQLGFLKLSIGVGPDVLAEAQEKLFDKVYKEIRKIV